MKDFNNNPYFEVFSKQHQNQYAIGNQSYKTRIETLNKLQYAIEVTYRTEIQDALHKDLGKPVLETELTEIYAIIGDIKYAKKHLHQWMRKQNVETPMSLLGSNSYIKYEPKGVCLIISPWNFPFNLTFGPLVSAIAAGNTVIIKPSEMTPNASDLMSKIVAAIFSEDEVAVVQGEVEVSTQLLKLPFNHIFFTGSPNVGKIVMKAASQHLASVTLELGGKSPTIIDKTANIDKAAKKIMWAKFLNTGQICVSPDYVLIDESIKSQFITACKKWIDAFYKDNPQVSESYGRIVTDKHFERLNSYLENAKALNAKFEVGGNTDSASKYIAPTIISDLKPEAKLLEEEIFGPILPIVTYNSLDIAIAYINSKPQPLALYIYSKSKTNTNKIINNTRAGGTCINNSVLHYANHELPFGGVNNSGIGKSHGFHGFKSFSNERAIMKQNTFGVTELLFPPYTGFKEKLTRLTIKWF
ncbi:aldehyde dehydrogenase family protein [Winogradskyella undariae]|uniref:aldehyde dehydrogenase family protein n=1 Tax=Winogradskyella TaxID=286104 RepID=UPI00156ADA81|nr:MULTISPECIES: aldehyde dehydrogenase family protein [Winogradskyella]NRR90839.1 aldehyde dehydrogenase family protein [Winogradskyella undariae]QXP80184.1 aldehyde dehydrogenase family protein [Winogradskyella sp. HaHa_3_26]